MVVQAKISMETFKAVCKAFARAENLDVMANYLAQLLVSTLEIKGCAILVLNPETNELELLASFGLSPKYLAKGPIVADKSIAANIKGKSVIVADVTKNKSIQYPEEAKKEGITAIVSIPIVFLDEVVGALRLYHYEVWHVSERDLDSLHLLANNLGVHMTNTRLLNAIQSMSEVIHSALPEALLPLLIKARE